MKPLLIALLLFSPLSLCAQHHDAQVHKVLQAMENGKWDFSPDWYFWAVHNSYSGAKMKWKFRVIPLPYIVFREKDSDTGRVYPLRTKSAAATTLKYYEVQDYEKQSEAMAAAETKASADRNVDLVYAGYKNRFTQKSNAVLELLNYASDKSKGKLHAEVTELSHVLIRINEHIAYIHKTGPGYELENIKREKSYLEADKELDQLLRRARHLTLIANRLY